MRWTRFLVATALIGLAYPALGSQPGCASCNGGPANAWVMQGLGTEACASPCGHVLAPGCCEDTRHCCDNAWAGYCDHRARVEAFWAQVGTHGAGPGYFTPCTANNESFSRDRTGRISNRVEYNRSLRGVPRDTRSSHVPCDASPTPAVKSTPQLAKPEPETAPMPPTPSDKASRATNGPRLR